MLEKIKTSCNYVAKNSKYVAINYDVLDEYIKTNTTSTKKIEIDYIHGADEVISLGEKQNSLGVLLPPIEKESFFETISTLGTLPRKSFSMGEADEKRFYLECRKLFSN